MIRDRLPARRIGVQCSYRCSGATAGVAHDADAVKEGGNGDNREERRKSDCTHGTFPLKFSIIGDVVK